MNNNLTNKQLLIDEINKLTIKLFARPAQRSFEDYSIEQLKKEISFINSSIDEMNDLTIQQKMIDDHHYFIFKNTVKNIQNICHCTKKKAIRHLMNANNLKNDNYNELCNIFKLNYSVIDDFIKN